MTTPTTTPMKRSAVFGIAALTCTPLLLQQTAAASPAAASDIPAPKKPNVFVVGDSLTVGVAPNLRRALAPHTSVVKVDARVSRATPEGISRLHSEAAQRANIWVVALGTNDSPSASRTRANVNRILRLAGPERAVVWVNVVRPGGYHRVNNELRRLDARRSSLTVLDWASIVQRKRGLLAGDGVHLTNKGNSVRVRATCAAVRAAAASRLNPTPHAGQV